MPFIKWGADLSVQVESIDEQHKKILEMIDELQDHVKRGSQRQCLDEALVRLSVYTVKHFIYEEALFKKHGYEHEKEHKKEHDGLADQVTEFHKKHTIQKEAIAADRLDFFREMICDHITTYDRDYINFMSAHEIK